MWGVRSCLDQSFSKCGINRVNILSCGRQICIQNGEKGEHCLRQTGKWVSVWDGGTEKAVWILLLQLSCFSSASGEQCRLSTFDKGNTATVAVFFCQAEPEVVRFSNSLALGSWKSKWVGEPD